MNTFTRKALYAAIAGVTAVGVASTAEAVNISADGLGQVLIYPYYTVRNNTSGLPFNTLLSVVNTTASVKAVKVRFREGRNSVEVLDFNVFLSPFDVWTATVTPTSAGGGQVATTDKSCTIPDSLRSGTPEPFRTTLITDADNAVTRTAEGYFEIFEMSTEQGLTAARSIHKSGVPDCGITNALALNDSRPATGGLFGGVIIVNPAGGGAFSQAATALANFNPDVGYQTTGTLSPQMSDVVPVSNVIQGAFLYSSVWNAGPDAVTATLLGNAITNEYVLDAGTKSQTSWIITMPTKDAYVNLGTDGPLPPFTTNYKSGTGACEPTFAVVFNREEASPQIVSNDDFSPNPPGAPGPTICWEATSVNFNESNVFGSTNVNTLTTAFSNGWSTFGFNDPTATTAVHQMTPLSTSAFDLAAATTSAAQVTYYGLPVIGFAAETFQNDALVINGKAFLSTFGVTFVHHKTTKIQAAPPPAP